ncbi:unnamed protein product, partial [Mesorhabditis belari]|uniref:Uncharacterized protein n=1 Tax=Mesorhabditis belari TaxID=2138241 RepID=A0AAF3EIR0_9BILA
MRLIFAFTLFFMTVLCGVIPTHQRHRRQSLDSFGSFGAQSMSGGDQMSQMFQQQQQQQQQQQRMQFENQLMTNLLRFIEKYNAENKNRL